MISTTAYIPLPSTEIEKQLLALVDRILEAVAGKPDHATQVGERLIELHCVGPTSLRRTVDLLATSLLRQPVLQGVDKLDEKVALVIGALAAGYSNAMQLFVLEQQESVGRALLKATREARWNLRASEVRFEEIFANSASGIAITDLNGNFVRANAALGRILERELEEFHQLVDIVHAPDIPVLSKAYQDLSEGKVERVEEAPRLIRGDGSLVRVSLAATLERDADNEPAQYVTMVDDDSELTLLGGQLQHQSLHDPLTGLPNRQYLTTRLESLLRKADPLTGATLYHLDLDAFAVITDGLGRQVGDQMLRIVAERLSAVFAEEKAMVARLEGDEFAVLVENSATTPDVQTMIHRIKEELAEPVYFDDRGVAVSATVGVVRRMPSGAEPAEVLRASDMTLRRAKRSGRRQWGLYDAAQDLRDQEDFSLAAIMPGAWESGDISVVFQPVVNLADRRTVGLEALLRWDHPEAGVIGHARCVDMAERTGLMLPLGEWLLRTAAEQLRWRDLPVGIALTASQANDPDLVGNVRKVLTETGLRTDRLYLGFPTTALTADHGEAADNLRLLAETGVGIVANEFTGSAVEVERLQQLGVRAVRLTGRDSRPNALITRVLTDLISVVHLTGGTVVVDSVGSEEQAAWWRDIGADTGVGPTFCPEPGPLSQLT